MVVVLAAADFAQDINVGKKVHLNAALALSLAVLAASVKVLKMERLRLQMSRLSLIQGSNWYSSRPAS